MVELFDEESHVESELAFHHVDAVDVVPDVVGLPRVHEQRPERDGRYGAVYRLVSEPVPHAGNAVFVVDFNRHSLFLSFRGVFGLCVWAVPSAYDETVPV